MIQGPPSLYSSTSGAAGQQSEEPPPLPKVMLYVCSVVFRELGSAVCVCVVCVCMCICVHVCVCRVCVCMCGCAYESCHTDAHDIIIQTHMLSNLSIQASVNSYKLYL